MPTPDLDRLHLVFFVSLEEKKYIELAIWADGLRSEEEEEEEEDCYL